MIADANPDALWREPEDPRAGPGLDHSRSGGVGDPNELAPFGQGQNVIIAEFVGADALSGDFRPCHCGLLVA
jgi:hypothetical protein